MLVLDGRSGAVEWSFETRGGMASPLVLRSSQPGGDAVLFISLVEEEEEEEEEEEGLVVATGGEEPGGGGGGGGGGARSGTTRSRSRSYRDLMDRTCIAASNSVCAWDEADQLRRDRHAHGDAGEGEPHSGKACVVLTTTTHCH